MAKKLTTCKVKCYAKFYENGKLVSNTNSTTFRGFKARITGKNFDKIAIKIVYRPDEYKTDPLFNSGTFGSLEDAQQFVDECSEKELLEYIAGGEW